MNEGKKTKDELRNEIKRLQNYIMNQDMQLRNLDNIICDLQKKLRGLEEPKK